MSSKLDRSLDEILAERPRGGSARRQNRGGNAAATGGIRKRSQRVAAQKATGAISQGGSKTAAAGKPVPTGPSNKATGSKIIVSNLPYDVSEAMIKEYFTKVVGPIKRCVITYGPNGMSRGIATVEFQRSQDAALAAQKYNGVEVDKRPMRVELVVDPATPSFADRIGAPKVVPTASKSASNKPKPVTKSTRGQQETRGARGKARGRGGRAASGRAKPKTTEELDAEMADYFEGGSGAAPPASATNGATVPAPAAANVDMDDDEVL